MTAEIAYETTRGSSQVSFTLCVVWSRIFQLGDSWGTAWPCAQADYLHELNSPTAPDWVWADPGPEYVTNVLSNAFLPISDQLAPPGAYLDWLLSSQPWPIADWLVPPPPQSKLLYAFIGASLNLGWPGLEAELEARIAADLADDGKPWISPAKLKHARQALSIEDRGSPKVL